MTIKLQMTQTFKEYNYQEKRPQKYWSLMIFLILMVLPIAIKNFPKIQQEIYSMTKISPPLVMEGGDPYIRALMRTISASEAAGENPYGLLYGGQHTHDLSHHPNRCITIQTKINQGHCSTAAGRYQFLTETWYEKAALYHAEASHSHGDKVYSFEPKYQDLVTYHWLTDQEQWQMDIAAELENGNLQQVLKQLSSTWTSLGYGIEDNNTTRALPNIYQDLLAEELNQARLSEPKI